MWWNSVSMFDPGETNLIVFIIAQIIGFVAFGFALSSFHFRKKEKILQIQIIDASLYAIHYLLLGGFSACATKILAIVRSVVVIRKQKSNHLILFLIIAAYFILALLTFQDWFSFLPPLAGSIYTIALWELKDEQKIRIVAALTYPLWIVYSIHIFSIAGFVSQTFSLISVLVAITTHHFHKNSKSKKPSP